jgi:predicted AAA+ superfamily ATPase
MEGALAAQFGRLIKSPKYLFFDMGVRRACANEGTKLSQKNLGDLFEQYVGTELVYYGLLTSPDIKVKYWRDSAGPEVDYVLDQSHEYTPIEVKWTDKPNISDTRHIKKFIEEYPIKKAYIICRTPYRYKITENIIALPWQEISLIFSMKI